jgi:hypothetical protein
MRVRLFLVFYDNIVDIYLHIFIYLVIQTLLHTPLVSCASISQAKRHSAIAISPVRGNKGCLYLIRLIQRDLVETRIGIYK